MQTNCDISCFGRSDARVNSYPLLQTACSKRISYQAFISRNALVARPHLPSPEGNGREKTNGIFQSCCMTKAAAPSSLLELTTCQCKKSGCQSNCFCVNLGLSCTETCFCMVSSWTQAMNLRTILKLRLIK